MRLDAAGFLRPHLIDEAAPELAAQALAVCPGATIPCPDGTAHPLWGPVLSQHRAFAADPELRLQGASGGALSAILVHLLRTGEVDFVLQVGPDPHEPLSSRPWRSDSAEEVGSRAGSRYAPAATLSDVPALLQQDHRFAVVAKPCEIAGLRNLAARDPRVAARIPYMLSFFCAGVPSLRGTHDALRRMKVDPANVKALRYRGQGWPGRMTAETQAGTASLSYAESWGDLLSPRVQLRCKLCPDGTGEHADLVAADAWMTADGYPDFEERDGISALLARNSRGADLLRRCIDAGDVHAAPLRLDELTAMQPFQVRRKRATLARLVGWAAAGRPLPCYRGMRLWRNAAAAGPVSLLRSFAGTLVRAWRRAGGT
jgi:coenzyme F420 hydrogenase subunit beta